MRSVRAPSWGLVLAVILLSSGCVELCGQRITINYDEQQDKLYVLFNHDGIHEDGESGSYFSPSGSVSQIQKFAEEGGILVWDWPLVFFMDDIAELADPEKEKHPSVRAFAEEWIRSVESVTLGHYRDADGRIGAAQFLIVSNAGRLVRKGNAAISQSLLDEFASVSEDEFADEFRRTLPMILDAAREGYSWVAIDGDSVRLSVPIHRREWSVVKAGNLYEMFKDIQDMEMVAGLAQIVGSTSFSLSEVGDELTVNIGNPAAPATVRLQCASDYDDELEEAVLEYVPLSLDERRAERLLGNGREGASEWEYVDAVISWGPPEETARALLGIAAGEDVSAKEKALELLEEFAEAWNRDQGLPEAPELGGDMDEILSELKDWRRQDQGIPDDPELDEFLDEYFSEWKDWYRRMIAFPLWELEEHPELSRVVGRPTTDGKEARILPVAQMVENALKRTAMVWDRYVEDLAGQRVEGWGENLGEYHVRTYLTPGTIQDKVYTRILVYSRPDVASLDALLAFPDGVPSELHDHDYVRFEGTVRDVSRMDWSSADKGIDVTVKIYEPKLLEVRRTTPVSLESETTEPAEEGAGP